MTSLAVSPPTPLPAESRLQFGEGAERARVRASSFADSERLGFARAFCAALIAAYWEDLTEGSATTAADVEQGTYPTLATADETLAERLGHCVARLDPLEAAYLIGNAYARLMPADRRRRLGAYYTPPALAERLLTQAEAAGVNWQDCRAIDPACGGGSFLAPLAKRMLAAAGSTGNDEAVTNVCDRLAGHEIDPFAAWLSQVFVEAVLWPTWRRTGKRPRSVVRICDSLAGPSEASWDLVVGNPPYGRFQLSPSGRLKYSRSLYGHANLYGVFTDLALRLAKPGGVIAYVTPTSFLGGEYFKNLRRLLADEAPPVAIDFVVSRAGVFDDVLQETLLAIYRRGSFRHVRARVCLVDLPRLDSTIIASAGRSFLPTDSAEPWLIPRAQGMTAFVKRLAGMPQRLRDWGYAVNTGPLVWNRHKEQLRHHRGDGSVPLVWAEAVTADGRFVFRAEKKNHAPFFQPTPHGQEWLLVRQACVLIQRTTAKEQDRRLIAALLSASFIREHGAVTVENHLNMVRPVTSRPKLPTRVLAAFLNTPAVDAAFRCMSGSVAVSAFELESMPLPPADEVRRISLRLGRDPKAFANACARLYGM